MLRKSVLSFMYAFGLFSYLLAQPVQDDLPKVTNCIAVKNVQLVSSPGKEPQRTTVIIRDGLITDVGSKLKIPGDAYMIEADSFYAYPAFIDAFSSIGIKEQEGENVAGGQGGPSGNRTQRPAIDVEGNPSLEDAGITPFRSVRSSIDPKDRSISDWRAQGFAIAHVVPKGKMLPGKGALLVLTGKNTDQLIWKEDISMFSQWVGAGGSYPSTMMGVMAKWRDLYNNASNNLMHENLYKNNSLVSRPNYNQAHEALMPVVKKEIPVFFRAPRVKDISRALALQVDLGIKMVITDAEEAWYLKEKFTTGSTSLVLSLRLPEDKSESKKEKEAEKEKKEKPSSAPPADSTKTIEGEKPLADPEKEAFEKRRNESLKDHRAQAATLANAAIPFSFGTMSIKTGDFTKNVQLMLDQGLNHEQALNALTMQPAKLLGIEKYAGSVETGKMANLIISNKPIFEKEAAIRYMIVEGDLYEYDVREKKKKSSATSKDSVDVIVGTWKYSIEAPDQKREGTFEFTRDGEELSGKIKSSDIASGNDELENIALDNVKLSFTFDFEMSGQIIELEFDLTLDGESFEGTVSSLALGSFPVTGDRIAKPNQ